MTMMPNEEDAFAELAASLDLTEPTDVEDLTAVNDFEISRRFHNVRRELYDLDEMYGDPKTDRGRELHSERSALLIEMSRRGLR